VVNNPDTTPPAIAITSPENKNYLNDNYALGFSSEMSDGLSGVEESSIEKLLNEQSFKDEKMDLSFAKLGDYSYKVSAKDKAGNPGSVQTNFQISTNLDAIQNNFNHYFDLKFVKNKVAKEYFDLGLKNLEKLFNLLKQTRNSKLKPLPKKIAIEALEKIIDADINLLVSQINRKSPSWIDPKVADFLVEDLNFIRP